MSRAAPAAILFVALCGCSLFHHDPPPQQRFLDALVHGNNAEAGQIWRHMDADDRLNLAHSTGLKPSASPQDIQNQLQQKAEGAADHDTLTAPDPDAQTTELPNLDSPIGEPAQSGP
ncbi:MAG: hypothetical protein ACREQD_08405 [Candidatus Binataceae bacterium]